jgi:hypothetical protein
MRVDNTTQKSNETAIREAFKALNNSISCTTSIAIRDNIDLVDSFRNAEIVLAISPKNSYIEIEVQDKDQKRYETFNFDKTYYTYEVELEFEKFVDYQRTKNVLRVKPINSDYTLIIDLKK